MKLLDTDTLARNIKMTLKSRNMTIKQCCEGFASKYSKEIKRGDMKPLNKDFVSRVRRGDFKTVSTRISKLCEFLKIPLDEIQVVSHGHQAVLDRQLQEFHREMKSNPRFKKRFSCLHPLLLGLQQSLQGKDAQDE